MTAVLTFGCQFVSSQRWSMSVNSIKAWRYQNHIWGKLIGNGHHHCPTGSKRGKKTNNKKTINVADCHDMKTSSNWKVSCLYAVKDCETHSSRSKRFNHWSAESTNGVRSKWIARHTNWLYCGFQRKHPSNEFVYVCTACVWPLQITTCTSELAILNIWRREQK